MYCKVLNFVPILDLFYSISRKTFILYVSPRVEWIAQKISWRTFPSKANKHTTWTWGYGEENASKVLKRKVKLYIYIYTYHPKKTRALFFLSQLFIAQVSPYSTILSRNWLQVWRGRQVERQRRWLWTFPKRQTVLKRMNRIPRILFHVLNSDLSDGLRSWRWRAFGRGVPDFQEASPSRLWKGTSVNQRVMKTFWFSLQKTHLMQRWYLFQLSQLLVDRRNPKEPPGMCKTL